MKISVENNLIELKRQLTNQGYDVYNLNEGIISDIYIYSERESGLLNLYNNVIGSDNGSFIIDADKKTIQDILYLIHNRVYSPLF